MADKKDKGQQPPKPAGVMLPFFLPLLVLFCVGCTTTTYSKRGGSTDAYARDDEVCQKEARRFYLFYSESRYIDCMTQLGYVVR